LFLAGEPRDGYLSGFPLPNEFERGVIVSNAVLIAVGIEWDRHHQIFGGETRQLGKPG
jgi:hypothetical protein